VEVHTLRRVPTYSSLRVTVTEFAPLITLTSATAISYVPLSSSDCDSGGTPPPGVPSLTTARTVQAERVRRSTTRSIRVCPDRFGAMGRLSPSVPDVHACPRSDAMPFARMLTFRPTPGVTTAGSAGVPYTPSSLKRAASFSYSRSLTARPLWAGLGHDSWATWAPPIGFPDGRVDGRGCEVP